ncbi:MAG: glutaredoxin 3 [Spongiibacteraceae bacterium]
MLDVYLYTTRSCPFCVQAKHLLTAKGIEFREISVDGNAELRLEMMNLSGRRTVPQIWVGKTHVGGCDELWSLERSGRLDQLLEAEKSV